MFPQIVAATNNWLQCPCKDSVASPFMATFFIVANSTTFLSFLRAPPPPFDLSPPFARDITHYTSQPIQSTVAGQQASFVSIFFPHVWLTLSSAALARVDTSLEGREHFAKHFMLFTQAMFCYLCGLFFKTAETYPPALCAACQYKVDFPRCPSCDKTLPPWLTYPKVCTPCWEILAKLPPFIPLSKAEHREQLYELWVENAIESELS